MSSTTIQITNTAQLRLQYCINGMKCDVFLTEATNKNGSVLVLSCIVKYCSNTTIKLAGFYCIVFLNTHIKKLLPQECASST